MDKQLNITLIAAVASNGVIGDENSMIWHFPKDMKRFSEVTKKAGIVIMGRKTHESIGRLLPDRINIVMTRQRDYKSPYGASVFNNIKTILDFMRYLPESGEFMVMGGGEIYKAFLPHASKMLITNINAPFVGDTYFPEANYLEWAHVSEELHQPDENHRFSFSFDTYRRIKHGSY